MSRITKKIADDVATQLTASKASTANGQMESFASSARTIYLNQLAEPIRTTFQSSPNVFNTTDSLRVNVPGVGSVFVKVTPVPIALGQKATVSLDDKVNGPLIASYTSAKNATDGVSALKQSVSDAILSLRTYANVEAFFPEAVEFLPDAPEAPVSADIDAVRAQLNA